MYVRSALCINLSNLPRSCVATVSTAERGATWRCTYASARQLACGSHLGPMAGANEYLLSLLALYGASSTNLAAAEENPTGAGRGAVHCKGSRCSLLPSWQAQGQQQHVAGRVSRPALRQAQRLGLAATLRLHGGSQSLLDSLKVPLAFAGWYLMSIVYSVLNKEVLTVWKFPCVFSAVQLLVGALWIGGLWTPLPTFGMRKQRYAPLREPPQLSWSQLWAVSSVAIWLALGHVMSTVAPAYGTVAFTNVVKTLEPLFTCLFSAVLLRQVFALPVYLSLVPVILGVALASASEVSFSMISLVSGLLSNVCFALRAISAKKLMSRPVGENMHAQVGAPPLLLPAPYLCALSPFAASARPPPPPPRRLRSQPSPSACFVRTSRLPHSVLCLSSAALGLICIGRICTECSR